MKYEPLSSFRAAAFAMVAVLVVALLVAPAAAEATGTSCDPRGGVCDEDPVALLQRLGRTSGSIASSSSLSSSSSSSSSASSSAYSYSQQRLLERFRAAAAVEIHAAAQGQRVSRGSDVQIPLGEATGWLQGEPFILSKQENADGGLFIVWQFPLVFNNFTIYWRRFGVDLPKDPDVSCESGCPVIVDFPGSGGSVYTQREWTKWYQFQANTTNKFILVTVEGSPDGITFADQVLLGNENSTSKELLHAASSSDTSWNVLGWGKAAKPMDAGTAACGATSQGGTVSTCTKEAMLVENSYGCYSTQLALNPAGCQNNSKSTRKQVFKSGIQPMYTIQCASASAANDWDYFKKALGFVVGGDACTRAGFTKATCVDKARIYYTGQSMGGMSSIQFATSQTESPYYMGNTLAGDLRPAAIVACSAGGSRNNDVDLMGKVPALIMQGATDYISAATPPLGYMFKGRTDRLAWARGKSLTKALPVVLPQATLYLDIQLSNDAPVSLQKAYVLQADVQQGGELLADALGKLEPPCNDKLGNPTGLSVSYYMWEGLKTTLQRVVGLNNNKVAMPQLQYSAVPGKAAEEINIQCAEAGEAAGIESQVRVCAFIGGHTYPWLQSGGVTNYAAFHEFIWEGFLKGGTRSRS
mmetsp:Transcript_75791/g.190633  ORF Transcript_75791/g.190633 Transcript_75791/m.190633 type:complete len:641 (+) Transcript_75791:53-1975(+)